MKALSSIVPSAHQPALFLIQDGIVGVSKISGVSIIDVVGENPGPSSIIDEPIPAYVGS